MKAIAPLMIALLAIAVAQPTPAISQETGQPAASQSVNPKSGPVRHKKDGKPAVSMHTDAKAEIMKLEKERDAAVIKGDVEKLAASSTPDYIIVTSDGVLNTKSQILDESKSG